MALEVEFKYKLNKLPDNLDNPLFIDQVYFRCNGVEKLLMKLFKLDSLEDISTYRYRIIKFNGKTSKILTLKTKGTYSRNEYEMEVNDDIFDVLKSLPIRSRIIKNRYIKEVEGFKFEFDEYLNLGCELITVEVEDKDIDKLSNDVEKILNDYFKVEFENVTFDNRYKNSNLIKYFGEKE